MQFIAVMVLLLFLFRAQILGRMTRRHVSIALWWIAISQIGIWLIHYLTGFFVHPDRLQQLLLPPQSQIVLIRMQQSFQTIAAGWVAAGVLLLLLHLGQRRLRARSILSPEDIALITVSSAAMGWPLVLPFLGILFLFSAVGLATLVVLRKRTMADRLDVSPFILPAAIAAFTAQRWLLDMTHLGRISF
jgi:hypothetical protein